MRYPNVCRSTGFPPRALVVALLGILLVTPPLQAKNKARFSPDCAAERARLKARLTEVFGQQRDNGSRRLAPRDAVLEGHPLAGTIALEIGLRDGDTGFLEIAQRACVDYANFVLANYDQDGDFLLERSSWESPYATAAVEDVGYNALLAIDLMSLSRLCIETNQPVDALFWYQGMKTMARHLVDETYDPDRGFFMPLTSAEPGSRAAYHALSAMPVLFDTILGDDIIRGVLRNHVLSDAWAAPDAAARYVDVADATGQLATGIDAVWALRSALLLGALWQSGFETEAEAHASALSEAITDRWNDDGFLPSDGSGVYAEYLACLIAGGGYRTLIPRRHELDMIRAVGYMYGVLDLDERRKLDRDLATIRTFLEERGHDRASIDAAAGAMRGLYVSISAMNAEAKEYKLFNPRDRQQIPGFDIYAAFSDLTADVIHTLREVENLISAASSGLTVDATVESGIITRDQPVPVRLAIGSNNGTVDVVSVRLYRDQVRTTLMASEPPLRLAPGESAREYWFQYAPLQPNEGTIHPVRFLVEVELANKQLLRYHFDRSVYIRKPLTFHLTLPNGNSITEAPLPLDIRVDKHVPDHYVIDTQWFSPSGLQLIEGAMLEVTMPAESKSTATTLHIQAPKRCRPGAFPYTMKIYGNGAEKGTVSGRLFKHYQWLFVGPFGRKGGALDAQYPPERNVDLRATYEGAIRPISWVALPATAYQNGGELDLASLVPQVSTSYLYTVVKTAAEKETTIWFESTAPAAIFVNGSEVLDLENPEAGRRLRAPVFLSAGRNSILIKMLSADTKKIFFQLGDDEDLTPDEFNNNLWELVDGYKDFYARSQGEYTTSQQVVTLTYRDPRAESVSVIGSFNGWSPENAAMRRNKNGEWELSLHLLPGRYTYRFLIDNATQVVDPQSSQQEPDGYGGKHSVLVVR